MSYINKNDLSINSTLYEFVNKEILPGTDIKPDDFWEKFEKAVHELAPINKALIQKREKIQKKWMTGIRKMLVKILIRRNIRVF